MADPTRLRRSARNDPGANSSSVQPGLEDHQHKLTVLTRESAPSPPIVPFAPPHSDPDSPLLNHSSPTALIAGHTEAPEAVGFLCRLRSAIDKAPVLPELRKPVVCHLYVHFENSKSKEKYLAKRMAQDVKSEEIVDAGSFYGTVDELPTILPEAPFYILVANAPALFAKSSSIYLQMTHTERVKYLEDFKQGNAPWHYQAIRLDSQNGTIDIFCTLNQRKHFVEEKSSKIVQVQHLKCSERAKNIIAKYTRGGKKGSWKIRVGGQLPNDSKDTRVLALEWIRQRSMVDLGMLHPSGVDRDTREDNPMAFTIPSL